MTIERERERRGGGREREVLRWRGMTEIIQRGWIGKSFQPSRDDREGEEEELNRTRRREYRRRKKWSAAGEASI